MISGRFFSYKFLTKNKKLFEMFTFNNKIFMKENLKNVILYNLYC